jgi:hypothetical protein
MQVRVARLDGEELDHEIIWGWIGLTCLVAGLVLVQRTPLPFVCPFRALTGLPCLTCGATRAFGALVRGDLRASLRLHPLVAPGVAFAACYIPYALIVAHANLPRVRVTLTAWDWKMLRVVAAVSAVAVWTFLILDGR